MSVMSNKDVVWVWDIMSLNINILFKLFIHGCAKLVVTRVLVKQNRFSRNPEFVDAMHLMTSSLTTIERVTFQHRVLAFALAPYPEVSCHLQALPLPCVSEQHRSV